MHKNPPIMGYSLQQYQDPETHERFYIFTVEVRRSRRTVTLGFDSQADPTAVWYYILSRRAPRITQFAAYMAAILSCDDDDPAVHVYDDPATWARSGNEMLYDYAVSIGQMCYWCNDVQPPPVSLD